MTLPVRSTQQFSSIKDAVAALARGQMLVVVDAPDRENEGDLVMAANAVTPASVNFMARHGRGLICVPMLSNDLERLRIAPMASRGTDPRRTAFHVGVDHRSASTGISASDRAATIAALSDPLSSAGHFTRPGHVFPLAYQEGGVLARAGHTEAAIDLVRLAGLPPVGVICEIAREDGEMARVPELMGFAEIHELHIITIADLIAYRRRRTRFVERRTESLLPLDVGQFRAFAYRDLLAQQDHLALVLGEVGPHEPAVVRVHSECLTGHVFGSRRCDCGRQLELSLEAIAEHGTGVLVYLRGHERLGIEHPTDAGDHAVAIQILVDLGIRRLETNTPAEQAALEDSGLGMVERVPLPSARAQAAPR
jgi:3,4-dihydroxy 2-butanone 4-phosphate synthase/GTP cyclohydrolase II